MRIIVLMIVCFFFSSSFAEDSIIVKKDARLDVLTSKQASINKKTSMMTSSGQYKGYRIQIISTSDRTKAFNIKAELLSKYPEHKAYTIFQAPSFRVRIGNFLKREDADKFRKQLIKDYPNGVFIVPDVIDYIPTEEEELELME
jgi:hypothetical protein